MNSTIAAFTASLLVLTTLISGCSKPAPDTASSAADAVAAQLKQVEADLHEHTAVLGSDEFEGRAPATPGEEKTVAYLQQEFADLGLLPGNAGSWFQDVPVTSVTTSPQAVMKIRGADFKRDLAYDTDMMVSTQQQVESVSVSDAPLVFVGYGITAPERNWDDYAGIDVTGKTVVVLINDPGYATQDASVFNGNTMTYYGRWTYKYEEAARQGAAAVLIVHETKPAAYPWEVVTGSWSGPQIGLTSADKNLDMVEAEAWVTHEVANELFDAAGLDYKMLKDAAARPGFKAVPMADLAASVTLENSIESSQSRNVVARLPGSTWPDEHIVYTAHWDHLGTKPEMEGDNIYNGASDNASGTAALFALAKLHLAGDQSPMRSIVFLAVTAEESGLLGSRWYGENPLYPLATTVANLNMDNIYGGIDGRTRDVAVVGFGNSELETYLEIEATAQGRVLVQEPSPEKGYYYRSDHFNFAKQGVPALYLTRGVDSLEHGKAWGQNQLDAYVTNDYHKPSDEYSPDWDLSGAAENVLLFFGIGEALANSRDWPNWNPGTEFKSKRDETSAERAE
ncbi:MAG: M28 family metallopeptidase [Halieaceae bacterium]